MFGFKGSTIIGVCCFVLCGSATAASAQTYSRTFSVCQKRASGDYAKISSCRAAELVVQNSNLNSIFHKLYAILNAYQRELLNKNESAWIQFRDTECTFRSSRLVGGPLGIEERAQESIRGDCLIEQTHSRAKALQDKYLDFAGGRAR
jgi:uncharacterized protein YecT (DUF1311 family)